MDNEFTHEQLNKAIADYEAVNCRMPKGIKLTNDFFNKLKASCWFIKYENPSEAMKGNGKGYFGVFHGLDIYIDDTLETDFELVTKEICKCCGGKGYVFINFDTFVPCPDCMGDL